MIKTLQLAGLALAGIVTISASSPAVADAGDKVMERCGGVAKAGHNDCKSHVNGCAGHATTNGNGKVWIWVPAGTCAKIAGGKTMADADVPNPRPFAAFR